jgi:hypothetical protein
MVFFTKNGAKKRQKITTYIVTHFMQKLLKLQGEYTHNNQGALKKTG